MRVFRVRATRRRGTAETKRFTPTPHVPRAAITIFLGTRLGQRKRPHGANAYCLRPQAEFTRASGRGLRRVKNIVQAAKGMCKKNIPFS
jgi:hypothetical protein